MGLSRHLRRFVFTREGSFFKTLYNLSYGYRYGTVIHSDHEAKWFISANFGGRIKRIYLPRQRAVEGMRKCVAERLRALSQAYLLDLVPITDGDTVVDVGANIGEIGIYYQSIGLDIQYIYIEPEKKELECCRLNNPGQIEIAGALWKESGNVKFYHRPEQGDSSIIQSSMHRSESIIPAFTLETVLKERNIKSVKLLKLEAEGAEPEVLQGAKAVLPNIQYISADLGPERGYTEECTMEAVTNNLLQHGFDLLKLHHPGRLCCLYKNRYIES